MTNNSIVSNIMFTLNRTSQNEKRKQEVLTCIPCEQSLRVRLLSGPISVLYQIFRSKVFWLQGSTERFLGLVVVIYFKKAKIWATTVFTRSFVLFFNRAIITIVFVLTSGRKVVFEWAVKRKENVTQITLISENLHTANCFRPCDLVHYIIAKRAITKNSFVSVRFHKTPRTESDKHYDQNKATV